MPRPHIGGLRHRGRHDDRGRGRHDAGADAGQGLAEYALILSLIVIFSVISLLLMGDQISAILSTIAGQL